MCETERGMEDDTRSCLHAKNKVVTIMGSQTAGAELCEQELQPSRALAQLNGIHNTIHDPHTQVAAFTHLAGAAAAVAAYLLANCCWATMKNEETLSQVLQLFRWGLLFRAR